MPSWLSRQVSPISLIGVQRELSVAGLWMTVVISVQDETSGPSGPTFKGRDAAIYIPTICEMMPTVEKIMSHTATNGEPLVSPDYFTKFYCYIQYSNELFELLNCF